mmetsp:Transcript_26077/g.70629  ORF Transcript_26077/g.70629 Transcript_26077/m.70629 type:complete len:354 (+) Transcript_26077:2397-3458(+)
MASSDLWSSRESGIIPSSSIFAWTTLWTTSPPTGTTLTNEFPKMPSQIAPASRLSMDLCLSEASSINSSSVTSPSLSSMSQSSSRGSVLAATLVTAGLSSCWSIQPFHHPVPCLLHARLCRVVGPTKKDGTRGKSPLPNRLPSITPSNQASSTPSATAMAPWGTMPLKLSPCLPSHSRLACTSASGLWAWRLALIEGSFSTLPSPSSTTFSLPYASNPSSSASSASLGATGMQSWSRTLSSVSASSSMTAATMPVTSWSYFKDVGTTLFAEMGVEQASSKLPPILDQSLMKSGAPYLTARCSRPSPELSTSVDGAAPARSNSAAHTRLSGTSSLRQSDITERPSLSLCSTLAR